MTTPPNMATGHVQWASIIASLRWSVRSSTPLSDGKTSLRTQAIQQLDHLPEPVEFEEVGSSDRQFSLGGRRVVGQTHGDSGMGAIRETHDEVRVSTAPDTNDRDLLPIERMMRMGDGYRFPRWLGG